MSEKREGAKLVELLHLALLQVMPSYLPVSDYAVKGGANLRLFYGSRRRSQDIDFDYLGNPQKVTEGSGSQGGVDRAFDGVEPAAEIVEVDVLGATAAAVEEPQVRTPLHHVVGDWQVGGHDLEQSQVEEFDQLRAFALFAHGLRLHE